MLIKNRIQNVEDMLNGSKELTNLIKLNSDNMSEYELKNDIDTRHILKKK
jgi:hypothetical protein